MTDLRVGRLLPACLHQAITEELPDRLEFYEHWLRSDTLRGGAVGLAAIRAVIGFLRTEPDDTYARVMARAGDVAVDWHFTQAPGLGRAVLAWMPLRVRARSALRAARGLMTDLTAGSGATTRVSGATASVDLTGSVFCDARGRQSAPLCHFYLALVLATLRHFGLDATGAIESCRAVEAGGPCRLAVTVVGAVGAGQARAA